MSSTSPPGDAGLTLDPGVLLDLAAAPSAPATVAAPAARYSARLRFTGDGGEYFRIWVVNTLLTLLTLGIYSAWAKVRKTRYFLLNTRLDGHVFDFHGSPGAILRGRLLALALLLAYTLSFEVSLTAGVVTILVLCLAGPWLFLRALQFRLRNTSHRGLRFDFDADTATGYRTLTPLLLIWFSGTVAGVLLAERLVTVGLLGLLTLLLFPWMHHRLKQFQHGYARYGSLTAAFVPVTGRFYAVYLKALLVMVAALLLAGGLAAGVALLAGLAGAFGGEGAPPAQVVGAVTGFGMLGATAFAYLFVWTFFAARVQQVVWRSTSLGRLEFDTHIKAREYAGLVLRCLLLTVLTLGLYWPWAAVRLARYRVQCMEVSHVGPPGLLTAGIDRGSTSAAGEGAVDLFGLDIGL